MTRMRWALGAAVVLAHVVGMVAYAADSTPATQKVAREIGMVIWAADTGADLGAFEKAASIASKAGATHMVISEALPRAYWEYGPTMQPGVGVDPYPAWYDYRPSLFKIFTPVGLKPYLPQGYADQVADVLAARCAILRKYHLRGVFQANEPQVLPEVVFKDHPEWRGPRVDQENRSTVPHFAACVDEADVLAMYRESMAAMLRRCPEITAFRFVTTDAGSGLCWASGLYPGANGPAACKERPMAERVRGFLEALQAGAREAGVNGTEIRLVQIEPEEWMTPTFADPAALARQMPLGTAINNFEAPGATPYMATAGWGNPGWNFFNPVRGIPNVLGVSGSMRNVFSASKNHRLQVSAPRDWDDLYARLLMQMDARRPNTAADEAALLQQLAAEEVGPEHAEDLVQVWRAIAKINEFGELQKFAYPATLGSVHQRWLTRPFVPFPAELKPEEKAYWRGIIFQAKGEAQADDLTDMQAMRLYKGWPGRMAILNIYNVTDAALKQSRARLTVVVPTLSGEKKAQYEALALRLHAVELLCANARNAVDYQAILDYLKDRERKGEGAAPDENPPLGAQEGWDRRMILEVARKEIDNTVALIVLLREHPDVIEHAQKKEQEDITLLGPGVVEQLARKVEIMNAHWQDYDRLTTVPNP